MKSWLTATAVWLASVGMLLPQSAFAAPGQPLPSANPAAPVVTDVALQDGGTLVGQVVDAQGLPMANVAVTVRQQELEVASSMTDAEGQFRIGGLRGGMYQVAAGHGAGIYRLWAPQTAPPSAQTAALVVSNPEIVRGQNSGMMYWLTNPWVLAGLIAAAIAIPIALNNSSS